MRVHFGAPGTARQSRCPLLANITTRKRSQRKTVFRNRNVPHDLKLTQQEVQLLDQIATAIRDGTRANGYAM